jgi:hypothetical protein
MYPMSEQPAVQRWRAALSHAARQMLLARWRSTVEALGAARLEYRTLHGARRIRARVHAVETSRR